MANQGLNSTTAIIITAKHGESSLDPSKRVIEHEQRDPESAQCRRYIGTIAKLTEKRQR